MFASSSHPSSSVPDGEDCSARIGDQQSGGSGGRGGDGGEGRGAGDHADHSSRGSGSTCDIDSSTPQAAGSGSNGCSNSRLSQAQRKFVEHVKRTTDDNIEHRQGKINRKSDVGFPYDGGWAHPLLPLAHKDSGRLLHISSSTVVQGNE